MNNTTIFIVIVVIVIVFLLFMIIRLWGLVQPYIKLTQQIIRIVDIINNFTEKIAIFLIKLIEEVIGNFKVFNFPDFNVLAVRGVDAIENLLDNTTLKYLIDSSKRVVVTAIGRDAERAVAMANQIAENNIPISLVTFDKKIISEVDNRIHMIDIISKNVSSRRQDNLLNNVELSLPENNRSKYYIEKQLGDTIKDYISSLERGFL